MIWQQKKCRAPGCGTVFLSGKCRSDCSQNQSMDSERAYVMELLHDIGRREGFKAVMPYPCRGLLEIKNTNYLAVLF